VSYLATIALAGAAVVSVGGLLCLGRRLLPWSLALQAVGMAGLGAAGLLVLLGSAPVGSAFSGGPDVSFGVDRLSGFFLVVLAVSAVPALVFAAGYVPGMRGARAVGMLTAGFLLAMVGVLTSRTPLMFITFWELMTLLPAAAIVATRSEVEARKAVFQYLAITHLGGAGVWVSLLLIAGKGAFADPTALGAGGAALQAVVALAAVVGFGTKAGIMPFHTWLPRVHPLAPSHMSALMSGVMIKVALYGLVRVLFEWLGVTSVWLAILLLALGGLSALGGVVYALFQHDLKRLLAFHSIENVGIIVLGLGASLLFQSRGQPAWAGLAFAAAMLHVLNHAVFKGLLFLGAGAIDRSVHGLDLDRLGGLLRRMPWTGGAFFIGAMAIAGLPPLNGFASEWLTLQSLAHVVTGAGQAGSTSLAAGSSDLVPALAGALALAALATTAALALFCFAKVVGLVLLGAPRRQACKTAREVSAPMIAATTTLAGFCIVLGLVPGLLLPTLVEVMPSRAVASLSAMPALQTSSLVRSGMGVSVAGTGGLPTLVLGAFLVVLVVVLSLARGKRRAAVAPVWACGQRVESSLRWTSAGFTKPLRLVMEAILRPERTLTREEAGGVLQKITYQGHVPHLFDTSLYRPVVRWALAAAAFARRLQSGSLSAYMFYLLVLVLLMLVVARIWGVS
jgi:hydrogenase-4 component B